jgi:hypothetical protein
VVEIGTGGKVTFLDSIPPVLELIIQYGAQYSGDGTPTVNASDANGSEHSN